MAEESFGSFLQGLSSHLRPPQDPMANPKLFQLIADAQFKQQQLAQEAMTRKMVANIQAEGSLNRVKEAAFTKYIDDQGISKRLTSPDMKTRNQAQLEYKQAYLNFMHDTTMDMPGTKDNKGQKKGVSLLDFLMNLKKGWDEAGAKSRASSKSIDQQNAEFNQGVSNFKKGISDALTKQTDYSTMGNEDMANLDPTFQMMEMRRKKGE